MSLALTEEGVLDMCATRGRRDHDEMEQQVRTLRALLEDCTEDQAALMHAMHETRAARAEAEQQLVHMREVIDGIKADWHRKLKDRRMEVGWLTPRRQTNDGGL
jgi:chromosome segregation ATPase